MNQWEQMFANHRIHVELNEINNLLESAKLKTEDQNILEGYKRLVFLVKQFTSFIKSISPMLTTQGYLDKLRSPLPDLKNNINAFVQNNNPANLSSANSIADQLTQHFLPFPILADQTAITETNKLFSQQVNDILENMRGQVKASSEKVLSLSGGINDANNRVQQLVQVVETQKVRLDKAISDFQAQFSASQNAQSTQHSGALREQAQKSDEQRNRLDAEITKFIKEKQLTTDSQIKQLSDSSKAILTELESRKGKAAELVGIISNIGITGNYDKYAHADRITANVFRIIALVLMGVMVAGAIWIIYFTFDTKSFDWKLAVFRMLTTAILAIPAFYAVRESSRHRMMEQRQRKMQLELASIDPYLESIEKTRREKLKEELAKCFFGQPLEQDKESGNIVVSLVELMKEALDVIKSQKK